MRNPVINMAVMWATSDIPDWCFVEAGLTYDPATPPTAEQVATFMSKSPITHINKVLHMYMHVRIYLHVHACIHLHVVYMYMYMHVLARSTCMYAVWSYNGRDEEDGEWNVLSRHIACLVGCHWNVIHGFECVW